MVETTVVVVVVVVVFMSKYIPDSFNQLKRGEWGNALPKVVQTCLFSFSS